MQNGNTNCLFDSGNGWSVRVIAGRLTNNIQFITEWQTDDINKRDHTNIKAYYTVLDF